MVTIQRDLDTQFTNKDNHSVPMTRFHILYESENHNSVIDFAKQFAHSISNNTGKRFLFEVRHSSGNSKDINGIDIPVGYSQKFETEFKAHFTL